jgi:hypothetical protein
MHSKRQIVRRAAVACWWFMVVAFVFLGCQQSSPSQPSGNVLGEGDAVEYAPGRTGVFHTVTLPGPGGQDVTFTYEEIDGLAIVQGDMIIGTAADFATLDDADEIELTPGASGMARKVCWMFLGIEIHCEYYRWPSAIVPYTFANDWDDPTLAGDENASMRTTIRAAMDEIEAVSAVQFVPRSSQSDYVTFRKGSGCSATVAHRGDQQFVNLANACNHRWVIAHEILHALGFNHEQSRNDRDGYVTIHWANIIEDKKHNFEKAEYSFDIRSYDYDSVMHYGGNDFCKRDASGACVGPTITTIPAGSAIGQRSHLSATDIDGLTALYPGEPPTIDITGPTSGSSYSRRSSNIQFTADVVDPENKEVTVTWRSDVSGVLGTGNPLTVNTGSMAYGTHVVTARARDPQGNSATDTVTVVITNDPPSVDLFFPMPGEFCVGESIPFRATVIDLNEPGATLPDSRVAWRVGTGSTFATGKSVSHAFASTGNVQVIVRATDELGLWDEDWVNLGIESCATDQPPSVAITTPASAYVEFTYDGYDEGRGMWYKDVTLVGSAIDPEDGTLTGSALTWTTDQSSLQNAVLGQGTSLTARLYSDNCPGTTHTITLTVIDSGGHSRSAVVQIRIWSLC